MIEELRGWRAEVSADLEGCRARMQERLGALRKQLEAELGAELRGVDPTEGMASLPPRAAGSRVADAEALRRLREVEASLREGAAAPDLTARERRLVTAAMNMRFPERGPPGAPGGAAVPAGGAYGELERQLREELEELERDAGGRAAPAEALGQFSSDLEDVLGRLDALSG